MSEVTTTKQNVQTASTVKKITATAVMAALTTLMTAYIFHNRSTAKISLVVEPEGKLN